MDPIGFEPMTHNYHKICCSRLSLVGVPGHDPGASASQAPRSTI